MRSHGEGTLAKRADGRWQGSIQVGGKRRYVYAKTKGEVAAKLEELRGQARATGSFPDAGKLTVAAFLAEWMDQAEGRLRPTTIADYSVMVRRHIAPVIGNTKLSKLAPMQLSLHYSNLGKTLSARRVRMVHDFLHKVLADATKWGLIARNPADAVDAPKREQTECPLLTPEQVTTFVHSSLNGDGGNYGFLLGFLLASGCRTGEALGLRWTDVDWEHSTVRVDRQIVQIGKKYIECSPKTRTGVRTLVLPNWGLDMLRKQRVLTAQWKLQAGSSWRDEGRVFCTEVGTVPCRSNVKRALHRLCDRLSFPRLHPHALRHISLSLLAMNGVPVKVAQARAGHSSPIVTMRVYQHIIGDPDRQAAQVLESALTAR